jgi:hypothetical protein
MDQGLLSAGPDLRIAIWNDGRVLFAANPKTWSHRLQEGKVSAERLAELKKQITRTGVFELKGNCYLVPDAGVDCLMVDLGTKRQMLYWDEVESPRHGININPQPHHLQFKQCWKAVNRLALACRPANPQPVKGRFGQVPRSWYLKPTIQSE